jgi:hypothetical protein
MGMTGFFRSRASGCGWVFVPSESAICWQTVVDQTAKLAKHLRRRDTSARVSQLSVLGTEAWQP